MRPSEKLSLINLHILKGLRLQTEREEIGRRMGEGTKGGEKWEKGWKYEKYGAKKMGKDEKRGEKIIPESKK